MAILDSTIIKGDLKVLGKIKEHGNSGVIFSTAEQIYGTWIDGKTIYWRTFIAQNITLTNDGTVFSNSGIDGSKAIGFDGSIISNGGFMTSGFHSPEDTSFYINSEGTIKALLGGRDNWVVQAVRLTVYYFKD